MNDKLPDEIRKLLEEAAKKLGYEPDVRATSDIASKCMDDVKAVMKRNIALVDDLTSRVYVAMQGAIIADIAISAIIASKDDDPKNDKEILERALFAMLWNWFSQMEERDKTDVPRTLAMAKAAWEHITGKTFDRSWLKKTFHRAMDGDGD